jgi:hypothetical protein
MFLHHIILLHGMQQSFIHSFFKMHFSWLLTCDEEEAIKTVTITNSMVNSPSWEANGHSASQEIPGLFWNLKVHYHDHKSLPLVPILSQMQQLYNFQSTSLRSILILSSHLHLGLVSNLLPSSSPIKIVNAVLISSTHARATCPTKLILNLISPIIQWSSSLCTLLQPPTASFL